MTHICNICASVLPENTDLDLCEGCDVALATIVPGEMALAVDQDLHELDEHEGVVV